MTSFPDQIETNPLAREFAELIRLEECNKNPDKKGESVTDYEVYSAFIATLSEYPEMLAEVLKGQQNAREIDTYTPEPGILTFQTTGHAHFLIRSLQCIKALLEFPRYTTGQSLYVNPIGLKVFKFQYNQALRSTELSAEDSFWITLAENLNVTGMMLQEIDTHLEGIDRVGKIQGEEMKQREAQKAINPVSEA